MDSEIEFFIASSEFMRRYARVLFNNKNTIGDSILDKFQLVNTEENINKFIERCNNILENSQYKLKTEVKDGKISNIMNIFKGDFLAKVNAEIFTRMNEIMARTGIVMAEDGIHSDPLLMINDEVQLEEQTAKLRNEAIKQLKEEHKDQADYEPTYSEVNKKFRELFVAQAAA